MGNCMHEKQIKSLTTNTTSLNHNNNNICYPYAKIEKKKNKQLAVINRVMDIKI
jgi:hypothetical protein